MGREDVVCTPHLGASTAEAQEGVSVEIAEAVVSALKASADLNSLHAFIVEQENLIIGTMAAPDQTSIM